MTKSTRHAEKSALKLLREIWKNWCAGTDGDNVLAAYGERIKVVIGEQGKTP